MGRLETATRLAEEAQALADHRRWTRTWPLGVAALIRSAVAFERNRLDESERLLDRAEELLAHTREAPLLVCVRLQRARLHAAAGRPEPALDAIEMARETLDAFPLEPNLRGLAQGLEALAVAALGRLPDAEAALTGRELTAEEAAALGRLRLLAGDTRGARDAIAPFREDGEGAFASTRTLIWIARRARRRRGGRSLDRGRLARARARRGRAAGPRAAVRLGRHGRGAAAAAPAAERDRAPLARRRPAPRASTSPAPTDGRGRCSSSRCPSARPRCCASSPR